MVQNSSSREEAQAAIYRSYARLLKAMKVKRIAPSAAQRWEDEALREARDILAAVKSCPPGSDLVIPPLPFALLKMQNRIRRRLPYRPLRPCHIRSPLLQACTWSWEFSIAREDYPKIPSDVDLGDPSTYWWQEVVAVVGIRSGMRTSVLDRDSLRVDDGEHPTSGSLLHRISGPIVSQTRSPTFRVPIPIVKRPRWDGDELDYSSADSDSGVIERQASSRCRASAPNDSDDSDEQVGRYLYVPRCDSCEDQDDLCHVKEQGKVCIPCKNRKIWCSACRGSIPVVKRSTSSIMLAKNKPIGDCHDPGEYEPSHTSINSGNGEFYLAPQDNDNDNSLIFVVVVPASTSRPPANQPSAAVDSSATAGVGASQTTDEEQLVEHPVTARYPDDETRSRQGRIDILPIIPGPSDITSETLSVGVPADEEQVESPATSQCPDAGTHSQQRRLVPVMPAAGLSDDSSAMGVGTPTIPTHVSTSVAPMSTQRALVDKSIETDSQPDEWPGAPEVNFEKALVSVIRETVELRQRRAIWSYGQQSSGATGKDQAGFVKELMSLVFEVVQSYENSP